LKDGSEETVFVGHYVLSSFSGEALVYSVKVSDSQASIFFDRQMSPEERKAMGEVVLSSWTRAHKNLLMMVIILSTKLLEKRTVDM